MGTLLKTLKIPCAFCHGKGVDPFQIMSRLSLCCVCGGTGKVEVSVPYIRCAHCRGTGSIKTLTCTVCRGKGVIPPVDEPNQVCEVCGGTGDDPSIYAMDCLACRGRGRVA